MWEPVRVKKTRVENLIAFFEVICFALHLMRVGTGSRKETRQNRVGVAGRLKVALAPTKSAGAGLFLIEMLGSGWRSVSRDDRAAPAIVHADGDEIDVLTDAIGTEQTAAAATPSRR